MVESSGEEKMIIVLARKSFSPELVGVSAMHASAGSDSLISDRMPFEQVCRALRGSEDVIAANKTVPGAVIAVACKFKNFSLARMASLNR